MNRILIVALFACVTLAQMSYEDLERHLPWNARRAIKWHNETAPVIADAIENMQNRAEFDAKHMRNYIMNFWDTTMGKTIAAQSEKISEAVSKTAEKVMPAMESLKENIQKLEQENMATVKQAHENVMNSPLRKQVEQQVQEVQ